MSIGVIGAGAFGTALAVSLAGHGHRVKLWARARADVMQVDRKNARHLPDVGFPDSLTVIGDLGDLDTVEVILLVLPAQQSAAFLAAHPLPDVPLVLCAKGIDKNTGKLQTEIAAPFQPRHAVLTGPGFAGEIAAGLPTALTLACADPLLGQQLQHLLSTERIRLYLSDDPIGAQLGGALKNVIAIAAGMAIGAGLGESARAALLTRGFAEMQRIGVALGAQAATFQGLSGLGDLALTCGSAKSRNFAQGLALGRGEMPDTATVEGIATASATTRLAAKLGVKAPIADAVDAVLHNKITISQAIGVLLSRPLTQE